MSIFQYRAGKHAASKRGAKHMSKRHPSGYHRVEVLQSQHQRVMNGRMARLNMNAVEYDRFIALASGWSKAETRAFLKEWGNHD